MMRVLLQPVARAASMNVVALSTSTLERAMREARGIIGMASAMITLCSEGPSTAAIASASSNIGNANMASMTRCATASVQPPR